MLPVFFSSSYVKLSYTEDFNTIFYIKYLRICREKLPQEFAIGIYRRNLPWLFAAVICSGYFKPCTFVWRQYTVRRNLPCLFAAEIYRGSLLWEFAMSICRKFFIYVSKSCFVYVSKSCLHGSKPFWYVIKIFLFVRFSFLTVFLFVIVAPVMGHRSFEFPILRYTAERANRINQKTIVAYFSLS